MGLFLSMSGIVGEGIKQNAEETATNLAKGAVKETELGVKENV